MEKFKPKKTTDDCYTPENIYQAVVEYVEERYGLDRSKFVRPFWPGGDYETYDYPEGCVVVDNPPFSILAKILRFYQERGIQYFLFAPALTLFSSSSSSSSCAICLNVQVIYENGAVVATSFLTSLEPDIRLRSDPVLYDKLYTVNQENIREIKRQVPKYVYPDYVATSNRVSLYSKYGVPFAVSNKDSEKVSTLDSMKSMKKKIYGDGYLLSEKAMAEKAMAEKAGAIVWELSDREMEIIKNLGT